jgi:hypothetical protein
MTRGQVVILSRQFFLGLAFSPITPSVIAATAYFISALMRESPSTAFLGGLIVFVWGAVIGSLIAWFIFLPITLFLRHLHRLTVQTCLAAGALSATLPFLLLVLDGDHKDAGVVAGWIAAFAVLGISAAVTFWRMALPKDP